MKLKRKMDGLWEIARHTHTARPFMRFTPGSNDGELKNYE